MVLSSPLYVICDADVCRHAGWTLVDFASACLDGGARLLQVRAKAESSSRTLDDTRAIVERAAAASAQVIVNDRADVARLAGAAGVHVGQDDLLPADARRIVGGDRIVGVSTHSISQLDEAVRQPIDYVAVGPVFGTASKDTGYDAVGLALIEAAVARARPRGLGVVAIGGITMERAADVIRAGATSV